MLAPVFAWLWLRLGAVGKEPSSPAKFASSLIFVAAGFAILIIPARQGGQVSPMWLTMTYLLHTVGELLLSPVGLSAMTKLAPVRIAGLVMGIWFLGTSVGTSSAAASRASTNRSRCLRSSARWPRSASPPAS